MVKLSFQAAVTDRFVEQLRAEYTRCGSSETVPAISWCRFYPYSGGVTERWAFASLPKADVADGSLLSIAGIPVYISPADQRRMTGYTLDFIHGDGVVQDATQTI